MLTIIQEIVLPVRHNGGIKIVIRGQIMTNNDKTNNMLKSIDEDDKLY